ncbi:MAG TPA: c-type cytochrome [Paracoccaceae bacterium]|nr:c-type cytochrome [Paracoccaceae bacterium]
MRSLLALFLGLALVTPALADEALVKRGVSVYRQFCAHCHGVNMVNAGTASFDLRKFPTDAKARFVTSVTKGKGNMPAWGDIILPEEVEALWVYVATRGGKEPMPQAALPAPGPEAVATVEAGSLKVCLARNGGAMSGWRSTGGVGLDYRMAAALAEGLGLKLAATWYESELDDDSDPVKESYAMLAAGLCDLVAGHPLNLRALGEPPTATARPPRWYGMPKEGGQPFVALRPVAATLPYARIEMGLVVGGNVAPEIRSLADLQGLRLGVAQGTLAGALSLAQAPAALRAASVMERPGPGFLWKLEEGAFDAALVSVPEYDFHRRQNPITRLRLTGWRHPLGFNIGFAGLSERGALIAAADRVIAALAAGGGIAALATEDRLHYAPPREPFVQPPLTRADLIATQ